MIKTTLKIIPFPTPAFLIAFLIAFFNVESYCQNNDNISLQGKSVMYRMGGKIFYGRALKNIPIEQQDINPSDSVAVMTVKKKDAFGKTGEKNLSPIVNEQISIVETKEDAGMKVRATDIFGNSSYENLHPLHQQKVILLDEHETEMRITTTDAFGNFAFENLNPEGNYKIKLQMADNPGLPSEDLIYLANSKGEVFQTLKIVLNKDFIFPTLSADITGMKLMEAVEVGMEK